LQQQEHELVALSALKALPAELAAAQAKLGAGCKSRSNTAHNAWQQGER
jgi:hypothetical protein